MNVNVNSSSHRCPCFPQDYGLRIPERPVQARRCAGDQHLPVLCGHHQSRAHPVRLGRAGGRQLLGAEAAGDAGAGASVVWPLCQQVAVLN